MLKFITESITAIIVLVILLYGMIKGRKVYEWFIEGAKEGLKVCFNIFPCILAMIIAVDVFRSAGLLEQLNRLISPVSNFIGLPSEIVPLVLIKPLSGSGALGVFSDIIKSYGADSTIGLISSVIMGTTETIFYTVTVYFGVVKIKKSRHTLWAALMGDLVAIIMAITCVRILIG